MSVNIVFVCIEYARMCRNCMLICRREYLNVLHFSKTDNKNYLRKYFKDVANGPEDIFNSFTIFFFLSKHLHKREHNNSESVITFLLEPLYRIMSS